MAIIFTLLFITSVVCLVLVLGYPAAAAELSKERTARVRLAVIFGSLAFIALLGLIATADITRIETVEVTKPIAFKSIKREVTTLPEGERRFERDGKEGQRLITYKVRYAFGKETSRTVVDQKTLKKAVDEIILVGTLRIETSTPEAIPFETQTSDDPTMNRGTSSVREQGVSGAKVKVYEVKYKDGLEISRTFLREVVIRMPVAQLVARGSRSNKPECDPNYSGCVPVAGDADCAGVGGDGPAFVNGAVQVIGSDIYGLDSDGDGWGCDE